MFELTPKEQTELDLERKPSHKPTRAKRKKKFPLVCPTCGTVATEEFADEPCSVCGTPWERKE